MTGTWLPFPNPNRLNHDLMVHVTADPRFTWSPEWLWHFIAFLTARIDGTDGVTLKFIVQVVNSKDVAAGYKVGYLAQDGSCSYLDEVQFAATFYLQIGPRDCRFFAVSAATGEQIPLVGGDWKTRILPKGSILL